MIDGLSNTITIVDDALTPEECAELIRYMRSNRAITKTRPKGPIDTGSVDFMVGVSVHNQEPDPVINKMVQKIYSQVSPGVEVQRAQLHLRTAPMSWHTDQTYAESKFTSVTYLNDDFTGGATVIRPVGEESDKFNTVVQPRAGRTVYFNGDTCHHCVTDIQGDPGRYTLAVWYRQL